ncbi:MAG: FlgD immunoglobulin-like domain containing protein [Candidatus Cloacimonadales bacterium]
MRKYLIMFYLVINFSLLFSSIIEVNQNGEADFVNIQDGIYEAVDNDTILVHPGVYYENIDFLEKDLTITSLNLTTNDSLYISNTIIDGNQTGSCVVIENVNNGLLQGFTLRNGTGTLHPNTLRIGGGVLIENSSCIIKNNNITENVSGGGIFVHNNSFVFLQGTSIYRNFSKIGGGGVFITYDSNVIFDEENLCSIYMNSASVGNDIYLLAQNQEIILDKFTVSEPDIFFICPRQYSYDPDPVEYTFSCQSSIIEPVGADLYVSADGDDSNSGLTIDDPLQTIALALIKIQPDSLNQRTIFVADGIYSTIQTNELFPLNLRSYISIIGESEENTILDGENIRSGIMVGSESENKMVIKNFTVENIVIGFADYAPFYFKPFNGAGEELGFSVLMENITIKNVSPFDEDSHVNCLAFHRAKEIVCKNITLDDNYCGRPIELNGGNAYFENLKITNTHAVNEFAVGGGVRVTNYVDDIVAEPNIFVNMELSNNENNQWDWGNSAIFEVYAGNKAIVSNATIVDNNCTFGIGGAILVYGSELILLNSIVHNNYPYPAQLRDDSQTGISNMTVKNCFFSAGENNIHINGYSQLHWLDNNISGNPLFSGFTEYPYSLSENSTCINAGTTDLHEYFGEDFVLPEFDIIGNPRIYGDGIDMGAYEWNPGVSNVSEEIIVSNVIELSNYPNPFNPTTTISFNLPSDSDVLVEVYNVKGQKVKTLLNEKMVAGSNSVFWNGEDNNGSKVSSGVYLYRVKTDDFVSKTARMLILK